MKQLGITLIVLAIGAFAAGPALAKGGHHSGGHAHHSSGHAHHSSGHAHKSSSGHANHMAKPAKAATAKKAQPKAQQQSNAKQSAKPAKAATAKKPQPKAQQQSNAKQTAKTAQPNSAMKSQPKPHQTVNAVTATHHALKTASTVHSGSHAKGTATNKGTSAATPATTTATTTPRATRATTVSHRGSYYHRGYGRRNYHRHRRNYTRNGRPSFVAGPDQVVGAGSGPQTVAPWATRIRAGSGRRAMGAVQFQVTNNSNPGLFSTPPSVSPTGTLNFTPAAQAGTATVTLVLRSGTATSLPRTFHITAR